LLKCTVLLAEDFEDTRDVYAFYLRLEGFTVHDLPDGTRVLALAIELQPDVVVLDLALPGVDGYALTAELRAHPLTAHLPIVVLSAHAYPEDEQRARDAGASAFLRKPCLPAELAATLRRVSDTCDEKAADAAGRPSAPAV
jgi:CheY-like chemotaxis protein